MERNKHTILKGVFVVVAVLVLMLVTKNVIHSLHIVHNAHIIAVLSGGVWAYLASKVFDMLTYRKKESEKSVYLQEALENVRAMKELTKK